MAQIGGLVETTRISSRANILEIFVNIREQIGRTHDELSGLTEALQDLDQLAAETPAVAREIETAAGRMERGIDTLPASNAVPAPQAEPAPALA